MQSLDVIRAVQLELSISDMVQGQAQSVQDSQLAALIFTGTAIACMMVAIVNKISLSKRHSPQRHNHKSEYYNNKPRNILSSKIQVKHANKTRFRATSSRRRSRPAARSLFRNVSLRNYRRSHLRAKGQNQFRPGLILSRPLSPLHLFHL